jgi:hypothetical protein
MKKTLIEICNTSWEILEVKPDTLQRNFYHYSVKKDELEGYTDFARSRIYVNSDMIEHRKRLVVVHECLHIIADRSGDYDMSAQEDYIRKLEHGVLELIQKFPDNYKL